VGQVRLTLVGARVVQVEEDRDENVQHIAALQHEEQELLEREKIETDFAESTRRTLPLIMFTADQNS